MTPPAAPPPELDAGLLPLIFAQINLSVLVSDAQRRLTYVNAAFTRETGYTLDEVRGRSCAFLQGPDTDPADVEALRDALRRRVPVQRTLLNYHKDGRPLHYRVNITPLFQGGELRGFVGIQEDCTLLHRTQQLLEHAAYTDSLTGLGNRRAFDRLLDEAQRTACPFALLLLDLDGFKEVNDRLGHTAGDQLLRRVAQGITSLCRAGEQGFRLGGDEFAVVIPPAQGGSLSARVAGWQDDLRALEQQTSPLSVGAASFPAESSEVWGVVRLADQRMYGHKQENSARSGRKTPPPVAATDR